MFNLCLIIVLLVSLSYKLTKSIVIFVLEEKHINDLRKTESCDYLGADGLSCKNTFGIKHFIEKGSRCSDDCPYKRVNSDNSDSQINHLYNHCFFRRFDTIMSWLPEISASLLIIFNIIKE